MCVRYFHQSVSDADSSISLVVCVGWPSAGIPPSIPQRVVNMSALKSSGLSLTEPTAGCLLWLMAAYIQWNSIWALRRGYICTPTEFTTMHWLFATLCTHNFCPLCTSAAPGIFFFLLDFIFRPPWVVGTFFGFLSFSGSGPGLGFQRSLSLRRSCMRLCVFRLNSKRNLLIWLEWVCVCYPQGSGVRDGGQKK